MTIDSDPIDPGPAIDLLIPRAENRAAGPFRDNDDYWALVSQRERIRAVRYESNERLRVMALSRAAGASDGNLSTAALFRDRLRDAERECELLWKSRCDATPIGPRVPVMLHVRRNLGLSPTESDVIHYLVFASLDHEAGRYPSIDFGHIQTVFALSPAQSIDLISPEGVLVRNEILRPERDIVGIRRRDLKIEMSMLKLLRGLALTREEIVMIGEPVLRQMLGADWHDVLAANGMFSTPGESVVAPTVIAGQETEVFQPSERAEMPPLKSAVVDGTSAAAYTSDLQYIGDFMEWLKNRYRWKSFLLNQVTDRGLWSTGDVPLEVQKRNLEMQERVTGDRIARRLAATRAAGPWLPRAEELAERRGLDEFEKSVILVLVCSRASVEIYPLLERIAGPPRSCVWPLLQRRALIRVNRVKATEEPRNLMLRGIRSAPD